MPGYPNVDARLIESLAPLVVLHDASAAIGDGTVISVEGHSTLSVQISGTFVATINFEATVDGSTWVALLGQNVNTGGQAATATAPGIWVFPVGGLSLFRARISSYTSGAVTVKARRMPHPLTPLSSATINATVDSVKIKDSTGTYTWDVDSTGAGKVQLTGSIAQNLQPRFSGNVTYYGGGAIAAGAEVVVCDVTGNCELESLNMGTNYTSMQLRIKTRKADGTLNNEFIVARTNGTGGDPVSPTSLRNQSNGENDFFKLFKDDVSGSAFSLGMKRQMPCGNGLKVTIRNQDTVEHYAFVIAEVAMRAALA